MSGNNGAQRAGILIVDDDVDIRETLVDILLGEGYPATAASNGREALEYLRATSSLPSLILLDLMMPEMDGWQFREEQRKSPELASIPTVVVSAYGSFQNTASLDVQDYLRKPLQLDTLLEVVARFCRRSTPS